MADPPGPLGGLHPEPSYLSRHAPFAAAPGETGPEPETLAPPPGSAAALPRRDPLETARNAVGRRVIRHASGMATIRDKMGRWPSGLLRHGGEVEFAFLITRT